jgi:tetratricopeptide (TPR) repeat protein
VRALVGRHRQLSELGLLIEGVRAGRGGLVVLSGEAGAGKTRLAEEATRLATDAGVDVAWATGWGTAAAPLSTFSDLLASLDAADVADTRGPTDLEQSEADPEVARAIFVRALVGHLRAKLADRPVLLVIDDVQWCDPLSTHVVEALVPFLRASSIGVLATLRDEGDALARFAGMTRRGRHLIVPPLTESELHDLAREITGQEWSASSLARLRDRSAGNVLFATGLLEDADVEVSSAITLFGERLRGLSPDGQRVLEAASLIGRRFRLDLLAEALGSEPDATLVALAEAHDAGLVREGGIGAYEFSHPLMAEACASSADLPRRIRLHRDIGEAMERLGERGLELPTAELAHHFAAAAAGGVPAKAVRYAAAAGREAMERLGYEDAARNFQLALAALDLCPADDDTRCGILLELADAHAAAGDLPAARSAYEDAARLARARQWPDRLARAALGVGSGPGGFEVPALDREQIALLEEASSVATGTLRAQVIARLSVALSLDADADRRARLSEEAIAAARDAADDLTLGYALASQCDVLAGPADVERRIEATSEILACATRARDTRLELLGRRLRIVALLEAGAIGEVDEEIAAYANGADRLSQVVYSWYVPLWRGMRAAMEGRLDESARFREDAARLGAAAHSDNAAMLIGAQDAMIRCEIREPGGIEVFSEVLARWPALAVMGRPGLAFAHAGNGDLEGAADVLAAVDLDDYAVDALGSEWVSSVLMIAYATALTGDATRAGPLYDTLLPHRARHAIDGIGAYDLGSVERALGLLAAVLGDGASAADHFERAIAEHRRIGARLLVAGTLRDAGRALDDASMRTEATALYAALGRHEPVSAPKERGANVFRREGDVWLVGLDGATTRVRDTKGMRDLARLLAEPNREIHALDLVTDGPTAPSAGLGDTLDATARRQYQARLVELEDDLREADERADAGRSERLATERDALLAELSGAYGLGGRARPRGESSERARSTVTQRVRDAIGRIESTDAALGGHLRRAVRTGTFCSYAPEAPVAWVLTP